MIYQSTRSSYSTNSLNAVLEGIATDGGLFIDPEIKNISFDWVKCIKLNTIEMAKMILGTLLPDFEDMDSLTRKAYIGKFETDDLTPLVKVGNDYILELFRGPTSAFKDVALSMLPQLITAARKQTNMKEETLILTATSGDTGKAALEGFHDVEGTKIIVFYPYGGVSPIQKAQMVTQTGNNVKVCAVKGNFDDCQTGVKKAFSTLKEEMKNNGYCLSSANSINIGRLAPQVVYYFASYRDLIDSGKIKLGEKVDFVVPTGNFGDILAGYYAKLLGLPVGKLVCASNKNNVLTDFINTGIYDKRREFFKTSSPSMDILVSSNLERMLYFVSEGNTEEVASYMKDLNEKGFYKVSEKLLNNLKEIFWTDTCSEEESQKAIKSTWENYKYLCDPHTSVAYNVAQKYKEKTNTSNPIVILSTASPYKFPNAVLSAIGGNTNLPEFEQMNELNRITKVDIPKNLKDLESKEEIHKDVIEKEQIINYVKELSWK